MAKKGSFYGWYVWALGTLFYLYQFILRASPSVMADDLMSSFAIKASSLGVLTSFYYYAYSALQIPIGIFLDCWGGARMIRLAIVICILGTIVFSFAQTFYIGCLGRILIGAGASGAFLGTISLARDWLPAHKVAFAVGATITFGKLGGILSGAPLAALIQAYSWRTSVLLLACFGTILAFIIWTTLHNRTKPHLHQQTVPLRQRMAMIFKNPQIWSIGIYGCLMYVPLSVFTDIWGVSFLMRYYCISKSTASFGIGLLFIGTGIGAPLIALLSDKLQKRKPLMFFSAIASFAACALLISPYKIPLNACFVLLFFVGLFMTGQTLVFAVGAEVVPKNISGLATGFINTLVMIGGVLFQPLVGFILDLLWNGHTLRGVPFYTIENYKIALSLIPICMLCATVILFYIPETHPLKAKKNLLRGRRQAPSLTKSD